MFSVCQPIYSSFYRYQNIDLETIKLLYFSSLAIKNSDGTVYYLSLLRHFLCITKSLTSILGTFIIL